MAVDFQDRSGKGKVPTNTGVVSSASEFVFGNRSGYFDGASYLAYPDSNDWYFATEDFTIDFWWNPDTIDTVANAQVFLAQRVDDNNRWYLQWSDTNGLEFVVKDGGVDAITVSQGGVSGWAINTWYHVAVVRFGNDFTIYRDGLPIATLTDTSEVPQLATVLYVGQRSTGTQYVEGYIDGLRVHKGKALWTENFLPPNAPVEQVEDEDVLLLNGDGTNGSTTIIDSGVTQHAITVNGDAQISTAQSKFGGSSMSFGGTGYLTMPDSVDWDLGSDPFTIELFARFNGTSHIGPECFLWQGAALGSTGWAFYLDSSSSLEFHYSAGNNSQVFAFAWTPTVDTWYHLAVIRGSSNDWYLAIDGVIVDTATEASAVSSDSNLMYVGYHPSSFTTSWGNGNYYMEGYIDGLRIHKGVALWTSDFVPPVQPTPIYDVPVTVDAETVLLLHCDGDNASTTFNDYGVTGHAVTANANAQVSTAQSKFGGASALFDGTGDNLSVPSNSDFGIGSDDFSIEFWVRFTSIANMPLFVIGDFSSGISIRVDEGGSNEFNVYLSSGTPNTWTWARSTNVWYHVSVVRSGNDLDAYVDGTPLGASQSASGKSITQGQVLIGVVGAGGASSDLAGYMDEIRLSKGKVRWIGNFTPPTAAYPDVKDSDTKLLIHAEPLALPDGYTPDTYIKDSSESDHDIFVSGDAALSSTQAKFGSKSVYFDGNDHLSISSSPDWAIGSSNMTLDMWFRITDKTTNVAQTLLAIGDATNFRINFYFPTNGISVFVGNTDHSVAQSITENIWYHLSLVKVINDYTLYLDGSSILTFTNAYSITTNTLYIGQGGGDADYLIGYIDELRLSKNIARWTSNFTPPTTPYSDYM